MSHERTLNMRTHHARALPLLLILILAVTGAALGLVGCDMSSSSTTQGNEVDLTPMDFAQHAVTVPAGTAVRFSNPASGITHLLCIGANATCMLNAPGPAELTASGGMPIAAGQVKEVVFATPGSYPIACLLHPVMNLTVTVQ
jgi:plastocyanin